MSTTRKRRNNSRRWLIPTREKLHPKDHQLPSISPGLSMLSPSSTISRYTQLSTIFSQLCTQKQNIRLFKMSPPSCGNSPIFLLLISTTLKIKRPFSNQPCFYPSIPLINFKWQTQSNFWSILKVLMSTWRKWFKGCKFSIVTFMGNSVRANIDFTGLWRVKRKFMTSLLRDFWEENIGKNFLMVVPWDQVGIFSGLGANLTSTSVDFWSGKESIISLSTKIFQEKIYCTKILTLSEKCWKFLLTFYL